MYCFMVAIRLVTGQSSRCMEQRVTSVWHRYADALTSVACLIQLLTEPQKGLFGTVL